MDSRWTHRESGRAHQVAPPGGRCGVALPGPEQAKPAAMPRDDRLRLDDVNGRVPAGPGVREPRPQDSIGRREAKTRATRSMDDVSAGDGGDDFQVQRGARLDDKSQRVEQQERRETTRLQAIGECPEPQSTRRTMFSIGAGRLRQQIVAKARGHGAQATRIPLQPDQRILYKACRKVQPCWIRERSPRRSSARACLE